MQHRDLSNIVRANSLPRTITDNDSLGTLKSRLDMTFLFSVGFN